MTKTALFLLTSVALNSLLYAQRPTAAPLASAELEVAGRKLHLGMTKAQVAEKLAGTDIEKLRDDEWMIGSFEKKQFGPTVQFTHGVLSYAERFWTTFEQVSIVDQLFGVVSSLNSEGFSDCKVTADTNDSPSISAKRVWVVCGQKSVLIIRRTVGGQSYDNVTERLGTFRDTEK